MQSTSKYDFWRGEHSLIDPVPNAVDAELREVVRAYGASDSQRREVVRNSMGERGFNDLIQFAFRSAVFALRENKVDAIRDGLQALPMMRQPTADFRDILMSLSLLYHAAGRIGADANALVRDAALLAEPATSETFEGFVRRKPQDRNPRTMAGMTEVETEKGPGFIHCSSDRFEPTVDLTKLALEVSRFIAADKYQPDYVTLGPTFGAFWISEKRNLELNILLSRVRAGAMASGKLRPGEHRRHEEQQLTIYIVETSQYGDARTLRQLSRAKGVTGHVMLGVAVRQLFALVVARDVAGIPGYETSRSLTRFAGGLAKILARYAYPAR